MKWYFILRAAIVGIVNLHPAAAISAIFLSGVMFWGAFNWSMELSNTETFCISCHEMRKYVYQEYKTTIHYNNRTGVRASCPDCHVPQEWVYMVVRKVRATKELYHWIVGSIDTPEKFAAKRLSLARSVWTSMTETDSRECRNCHDIAFMAAGTQAIVAGKMHELAKQWDMTCIDCHKGIAHTLPREFDKNTVLDVIHNRMEKEKTNCAQCHKGMAGARKKDDWN